VGARLARHAHAHSLIEEIRMPVILWLLGMPLSLILLLVLLGAV